MKILSPPYKRSFYWALALHIVLLVLICLNWQFSDEKVAAMQPDVHMINAVVVNATPIAQPSPQKSVVKTEPPALSIIKQQEKQEEQRLPPKPVQAKTPPKIQETKIQQSTPKPIPKPVPVKKQQPTVDKQQAKLRQQREAELQKQLQRDATLQEQKTLTAKDKANAERLLQQQLAAEDPGVEQKAQAASAATSGVVDKYKALILAAISQQWIVPPNAQDKFCKLLVRLAPGGVVLDVSLVQSSGDSALDRSARAAVFKASPLPVPKETALFDSFRELNLTVHPKTYKFG